MEVSSFVEQRFVIELLSRKGVKVSTILVILGDFHLFCPIKKY